MTDQILTQLSPRFQRFVCEDGPAVDRSRETAAGTAVADAVHGTQRAHAIEQLDYDLLFRWFVGLNMDDALWNATVFTKNRHRLLEGDLADAFFQAVPAAGPHTRFALLRTLDSGWNPAGDMGRTEKFLPR